MPHDEDFVPYTNGTYTIEWCQNVVLMQQQNGDSTVNLQQRLKGERDTVELEDNGDFTVNLFFQNGSEAQNVEKTSFRRLKSTR